jgi:uncharacterized protein with PIN domain
MTKKRIPYYRTEAGKAAHRKSNLKRLYQITPEAYEELLQSQHSRCAICQRHQSEFAKPFVVDHDHKTMAVRALLCPACNTAIGLFGDDPATLERAAEYLKQGGYDGTNDRTASPGA